MLSGSKAAEKEQADKLKALRRELEDKLEEQLPPEMLETQPKVEVQVITGAEEIDPSRAKQVIEALLFASTRPLTVNDIRRVMKSLTPSQISGMIEELKGEYEQQNRSFEIHEVANGYEVGTRREFAPWIMRVELQKKAKQVTQSALETLAILAYKQPITRPEIEALRGVDVSGVVNTLMERDLVKIVGRKEVPGRPFMYGTTEKFLEHFGLKGLGELPSIEEIKKMVENSVNKEELLGRAQIVDMPQVEQTPAEESASADAPQQEVNAQAETVEESQPEAVLEEETLSEETSAVEETVTNPEEEVTQPVADEQNSEEGEVK